MPLIVKESWGRRCGLKKLVPRLPRDNPTETKEGIFSCVLGEDVFFVKERGTAAKLNAKQTRNI
ncbi:MAG: hypothetical protein Q7K21_09290 [Elusimicrobiota bacterium]|nr:hypothetical protein [Elusimicrobiota bacterium]